MNALWSPLFIALDRPVFAWDSWFARLTMAKRSVTDYYFAIGTDRMTEQHAETEEPCEFKFCVKITLCHVFLMVRISRCSFHLNRWIKSGASVQGSKSLSISPSGGEEWRFCLGCVARQSNRHCCFIQEKSEHPSSSNTVKTSRRILLPPIGREQFTFHFWITLYRKSTPELSVKP